MNTEKITDDMQNMTVGIQLIQYSDGDKEVEPVGLTVLDNEERKKALDQQRNKYQSHDTSINITTLDIMGGQENSEKSNEVGQRKLDTSQNELHSASFGQSESLKIDQTREFYQNTKLEDSNESEVSSQSCSGFQIENNSQYPPQVNRKIENEEIIESVKVQDQNFQEEITEQIKKNKWVKPKYIDDFIVELMKSLQKLDWQTVLTLLDDYCEDKYREQAESYFKQKLDTIQQPKKPNCHDFQTQVIISEAKRNNWIKSRFTQEFTEELERIFRNSQNEDIQDLVENYCNKENTSDVIAYLNKWYSSIHLNSKKQQFMLSLLQEVKKEIQSKDLIKQQFQQEFIVKISEGFSQENLSIISTAISDFALPKVQRELTNYLNQQFTKFKQLTHKETPIDKEILLNKIKEMNWVKPKFQNQFVEEIYPDLQNQNYHQIEETINNFCDEENQREILVYFKSLINSDQDSCNQSEQQQTLVSKETILEKIKLMNWIKPKFQKQFVDEMHQFLEAQHWESVDESIKDFCDNQQCQRDLSNYLRSLFNSDQNPQNQSEAKSRLVSKEIILDQIKQKNWVKPKFQNQFMDEIYSLLEKQQWNSIEGIVQDYCDQQSQRNILDYFQSLLNSNGYSPNQQEQNSSLLLKQQLKNELITNSWIQMSFLENFHEQVFLGIVNQDWEAIKQQIDDFCQPKNQHALEMYLKKEFNEIKQLKQNSLIAQSLERIPQLSTKSFNELHQIVLLLRQEGFKEFEFKDDYLIRQQIFRIEQETPFIYKRDLILVQMYTKEYSSARLTESQLKVLLLQGFDNLAALTKEFSFKQMKLYESELQKPMFRNYISQIVQLNFRQRLILLLKCLNCESIHKEITIDDYLFSETFKKQQKSSHHFELSKTINNSEVNVFLSDDEFQSFYIKCIIIIEKENQRHQFSSTLNFILQIQENPLNIVDEIFNQQPNSDYLVYLEQVKSYKQSRGNDNQFVLDFIKIITKDSEVKKYFTQRLFEETLSTLQIAKEDVDDLFDEFVDHGLTYFYQSDHIDSIQNIIKQVQENLLLKAVYGKTFFSEDLKLSETYFNFKKGKKQAEEYDRMFHVDQKISLEEFMKYDSKDYDPKSIQIRQSIESILNNNFQVFTEKIFNLIIQLSKRNQDLQPIFQELKTQLLQNKYTQYDISKKIVTEYLLKHVDDEVRQKMIYLIGYSNPIPFITSRPLKNENRIEQSVMKDALWLLSKKDLTVASIGFGYVRGKSTFLNEAFITSFDISNKSFIYQGSADIQSNQLFKTHKRDYFVIDFHGDCLDVDDNYLIGFYNYRIIQITSAFLFSNNFQKVTSKISQKENKLYDSACYIVRDFSEAKPHYQEYFNVELVRQKLGLEFFNTKQVILLPNLQRVSSGDRAFLIQKSREFLDSQIKLSCLKDISSRQIYLNNENILKKNDPQSRIHDLIDLQLQSILYSQQSQQDEEEEEKVQSSSRLFILYPLFSRFQKTQLKLTKKHYLQKSSEVKLEETDLDKQYLEQKTMYQQYQIKDRSEASRLFENIITSKENLCNTMALFIKELKIVNDFQIQGYISQKRNIQGEIGQLLKQNQPELEQLIKIKSKEKQDIETKIEETSLSVEIFWREIMQYQEKDKNYIRNKDIINSYRQYIKKGFPFEIIDGDNFYFAQQFLKDVFNCDEFKDKKICVISIVGPQNSGKSTLLNYLFGCDFNVSDGRCTKGIYGTIIESNVAEFDLILVIDSEGLQSLEKNDPEYDRKITLFCLTVSHLVIINVKDQFQSDMLQLLEVCISGRQNIQSNTIYQPIIEIIFNQTADPDLDNAQQAIDNAMQSLEKNKLLSEINTSNQNVTSLPSAVTSQLVTVGSDQEQWRYLKTQVDFVERVNKLGIKIINKLKNNFKNITNNKNLLEWIDLAHCIYETIKVHPNLTAFKDIKEKQTVEKIQKYIQEEIDSNFTTEFYTRMIEETEKRTKDQSQIYIQKICEEKKQKIILGYERMCKTIDFDIGDLFQIYRKFIGFSIDSKYNNYLNNIVIQKNNDLIQNSLDHCKYGVQKKMNELKQQGISSEQARQEYKIIFQKELDAIQNNLPNKNQINLDILQFISDQYQLYYNHGLILLPEEGLENISKKDSKIIMHQLNRKLMELTQQKSIFYLSNNSHNNHGNNKMRNQNDITNFLFTNESFKDHISKLKTSIINCDQIQKYYKILQQLINIALSKNMKLIHFTNEKKYKKLKKTSYQYNNLNNSSQNYFYGNQYSQSYYEGNSSYYQTSYPSLFNEVYANQYQEYYPAQYPQYSNQYNSQNPNQYPGQTLNHSSGQYSTQNQNRNQNSGSYQNTYNITPSNQNQSNNYNKNNSNHNNSQNSNNINTQNQNQSHNQNKNNSNHNNSSNNKSNITQNQNERNNQNKNNSNHNNSQNSNNVNTYNQNQSNNQNKNNSNHNNQYNNNSQIQQQQVSYYNQSYNSAEQYEETTQYIIDDSKINEYNSALRMLEIEIDKSFIKSQIESNIRVLDERQKLIMNGKEEFIKILKLDLKKEEELSRLQTDFQIKIEKYGYFRGQMQKMKDYVCQEEKKAKQQIQYWKPFTHWIRSKLQDSFVDIINIQQFVDNIKQSIEEKIVDKQVNEELIQSIQGYVNSEIKKIESNLEIFSIKFTNIFKSYIHTQTLMSLYFQEQKYRSNKQQKPIQDFQHKQKDLLDLLMQKYEAKDDLNKISAIEFKDYIYQQANLQIQLEIQKELTHVMQLNEQNISKLQLQKDIELNLMQFDSKQANEYLTQPQVMIQQKLNVYLNQQKDQLTKLQKEQIQSIILAIQDIEKQLQTLGLNIQHQLSANLEQKTYDSVFQTFEIQNNLNSQAISILETEKYQSQAFTEFVLKTLIRQQIMNSEIKINQVSFNFKLKQPSSIYLEQNNCNIIQELLISGSKEKILINDLTYFSKCFSDLCSDLIQKIESIDFIQADVVKTLNTIEQRILNQCNVTCPCCNQSCDQDHWKHSGVPIGEGINKHTSKAGHRYVAFKGVKIERLDEPALIICHDYQDQNIIVNNNQRMTWQEFKEKNADWDWKFTDQDKETDRAKWSYIWKLVGKDLCNQYGIKNYKETMNIEQIQNSLATPNSHFIFIFDESGSMDGDRFESLKQSLKSFINERLNKMKNETLQDCCSLIGFDGSAKIHAHYELITPQLLNRIPNKNSGGLTSFSNAISQLNTTLSLNRDYDGNIIIAFLSDGESSYPERELDKLVEEYPNKIKQFLIVGFGGDSQFPQLIQMENRLRDNCGGKFIQTLTSAELKQSFEQLAFIIPNSENPV